jgi:FemAB-related protein (PEP-CTERM system-associated)
MEQHVPPEEKYPAALNTFHSDLTTEQSPVRTSQLQIRLLEASDISHWDAFVNGHPFGTPFHLLAWKRTLEDTFGYRPYYLLATGESGLHGVLPLFLVKNAIIGKALISTPFAVYGGILANSVSDVKALHQRAVELGKELRVDYVEFRNAHREQCATTPNVDRYVSFTQPLVAGENALLESLPRTVRNKVRKSLKQGFEMRYHSKDLRNFEKLYAKSMRRLGTPCFPAKYFANLVRNFGEMVDVREVWLDGKPMAASLNFIYRDDMHIYYSAADADYNHLAPNTFMYFDQLRWGGDHGLKTFDFGRCKRNTGVFEFKRHWNTVMRELPYEVALIKRKDLPNFSPVNPKFEMAIKIWRMLPLWLTRVLGPRLIRLFP